MGHAPDDLLWMTEARMLSICGLPRSTFQSWARSGAIERDPGAAYGEGDVLRIALLGILRDHLPTDTARSAWDDLRVSGLLDDFVTRARTLEEGDRFDLVLEVEHAGVIAAFDDIALIDAVRRPEAPRAVKVVPAAERLRLVRDSFRRQAARGQPPGRRRGRPPRARPALTPVEGGG